MVYNFNILINLIVWLSLIFICFKFNILNFLSFILFFLLFCQKIKFSSASNINIQNSSNSIPNAVLKSCLNRKNGLKISHLNIWSINAKIDELRIMHSNVDLHVLCFSETYLNSSISDTTVSIPGYYIYRNDRD